MARSGTPGAIDTDPGRGVLLSGLRLYTLMRGETLVPTCSEIFVGRVSMSRPGSIVLDEMCWTAAAFSACTWRTLAMFSSWVIASRWLGLQHARLRHL